MRTVTQMDRLRAAHEKAHEKAVREALSESRKRGPKFWALAVEIRFAIAAVTDSDYAAEMLILDYLQSLPEGKEPPCRIGGASSHPVTGRPIVFSPRTWGINDGRGLQIVVQWPHSQVVATQGPVPLETGPAGEISNTEQVVHRLLAPFGALPEGRYTNDLVRLPRSIMVDILRFGGLPIPPELLETPKPTTATESTVLAVGPPASTEPAPILAARPIDWFRSVRRMKENRRREGETPSQYIDRMLGVMMTAKTKDEVTHVWDRGTMARRLREPSEGNPHESDR